MTLFWSIASCSHYYLLGQVSSGNAATGGMHGPHVMQARSVGRPMSMMNMQRMPPQGMSAYNLASQAGMGAGMNPGNMPMPRGVTSQAHQQQVALSQPGIIILLVSLIPKLIDAFGCRADEKERSRNGNAWISSTTEISTVLKVSFSDNHAHTTLVYSVSSHLFLTPFPSETRTLPSLTVCFSNLSSPLIVSSG